MQSAFTVIILTINNKLSLTAGSASVFLTAVLSLFQVRGKMSSFQSFSSFPLARQELSQVMRNTSKQYEVSRQTAIKHCQLQKELLHTYNIHHIKQHRARTSDSTQLLGCVSTDALWYFLYVFFVHLSFMATLFIFVWKRICFHLISPCKWKRVNRRKVWKCLFYTSVRFLPFCFSCHVPLLQHGLIMVSLRHGDSKQNMLALISEHSAALFPTWDASTFLSFPSALPLTACH